ncbi:IclR family transcriptional regulator [Haloarcula marina]|uniref:IclR family transcriptional regulator n=1 Tax=Haloarcula marina TaxID=2961574 RepID=UPI0020B67949|nr:IclR family transcriptional regulator [Halomicroarcula marina]
MTDQVPVRAAKTSLEIINKVRELEGAGVSELANELDKPTSTVHDHLRTLESEEYLIKSDSKYYVGTQFLDLGEHARSRHKMYTIARQEVDELATQTGEHTNLMIEEHGRGVFLYKSKGPDTVQLDTHAGMRVPLQTTAMGKSILAFRPSEEVDEIINRHGLPQLTEKTITDRDELYDELDEIQKRGYAYADEERVKGMRSVAAPITNDKGRSVAAIGVTGPKRRLRGQRLREDVPDLILSSANVIEVNPSHS